MKTMTFNYRDMAAELRISESRAREYMGRFNDDNLANVPREEMDYIISKLVFDGVVARPVKKAGRPVIMKDGFIGDRVSKNITMDLSVKRIIEKYSGTSTMSGFIEDAVILYDKIISRDILDHVLALADGE